MPVSLRHLAMVTTFVVVVSGCADSTTRPTGSPSPTRSTGVADVELTLVVQPSVGSPANPIAIGVTAVHTGGEVWRCDGCGCGNGISIEVIGPDGAPVALDDPAAPQPLCPDVFKTWAVNDPVMLEERFTGTLYEKDSTKSPSPTYPAPAGTYTVIARFDYAGSRDGESTRLERTTTFEWNP